MSRSARNILYHFAVFVSIMANTQCSSIHPKMSKMNPTAKEIIHLGKKHIVQMAKTLIMENSGEKVPDSYDARVFANDSSVIVLFDLPIHFAAKNTAFYYGATVDAISKTFGYTPIINTEAQIDAFKHFPFYEPSKQDMKTIEFVLGGTTSFRKHRELLNARNEGITIIETDTFYTVQVLSQSLSSQYNVDKRTGIASEHRHRHIKTESLSERGYVEIIK
ncbi:hypothetical protein D2V93_00095 [Flagellimonas taeanensis]|nr:hypothetical protein D2V93_12590 [Allomuricauda taeanensis]RIV53828.1 hypothetical protein D2V93_00095 [Allomuricauda taeanensis]